MPKLTGTVTMNGGNTPALTAVVELHNRNGDILDQVQVDESGRYSYHLIPGEWRLRIWDAHGHRGTAELEMTSDDQVVDVDLEEPEETGISAEEGR